MDIELALNGVHDKLLLELPAKVDAMNAATSDGVDILMPPPEQITIGVRAELTYPWIMVLADGQREISDDGYEVLADSLVKVVVWVAEANEDMLWKLLVRTQMAAKRALLKDREIEGAYSIYWADDDYGPVFRPTPTGYFVQSVASIYRVKIATAV
jgi:hypothetical protein